MGGRCTTLVHKTYVFKVITMFCSFIAYLVAEPRTFQDSTWFTQGLVLITFMGHWYFLLLIILVTIFSPRPLGDLHLSLFSLSGMVFNFATAATLITEMNSDDEYGATTLEGFMIVLITAACVNFILLCIDLVYTWKEQIDEPMDEIDLRSINLNLRATEDSLSIVSDYTV